jgi:hypothetical protein
LHAFFETIPGNVDHRFRPTSKMSKFEHEVRFLPNEVLQLLYEATVTAVSKAMEPIVESFQLETRPTLAAIAYIEHEHLLRKMSEPRNSGKQTKFIKQPREFIGPNGEVIRTQVCLTPSQVNHSQLSFREDPQETQPPPQESQLPSQDDATLEHIGSPPVQSAKSPHKEKKKVELVVEVIIKKQ